MANCTYTISQDTRIYKSAFFIHKNSDQYENKDELLENINKKQADVRHLYKAKWGKFYVYEEYFSHYQRIFREEQLDLFLRGIKEGE